MKNYFCTCLLNLLTRHLVTDVMVEVFSLILGMSIPWCGKIGKGKFPQSSLKAHFIFPSHGLAVMVKKNFPSRGFAAPGEIFVSPVAAPPLLGKLFFTNPAKPFLGKIKCAFRDSWGNFYFPCRGFATPGENPHPYFSTPRDWVVSSESVIFRIKENN